MQLLSRLCRKGNGALQCWKGLGSKAYSKSARRTATIVYDRARTTVESSRWPYKHFAKSCKILQASSYMLCERPCLKTARKSPLATRLRTLLAGTIIIRHSTAFWATCPWVSEPHSEIPLERRWSADHSFMFIIQENDSGNIFCLWEV